MILAASFALLAFGFWAWMLVDCLQRTFKNRTDKLIWVLALLVAHILGALILDFFVVKRKD